MNDQTSNSEVDETETDEVEVQPTEIDLLKARAVQLGIPVRGNMKVSTLRKKIEDKISGSSSNDDGDEDEENDDEDELEVAQKPKPKPRKMTQEEVEQALREKVKKEKMKLLRCRISNLNPAKNDLRGEIITVGNRYLGTVRKFIPFGEQTDRGYHIPQVIYDDLKARRFQQIRSKRVNGQIMQETRMVPEYQIEILPPLSVEALNELRMQQEAARRLGGSDAA